MAINYPTSLDNFPNPQSTDLLDNASPTLDHWTQHSNNNDAIEALEAKVGIDGSAVTTSFDYKLSGVTGSDKAVSKTGTETLTNKTLTSPTITGGTLTTSTVNGVTLSSTGSASNFLKENGTYGTATAGDASYAAKGSVQGLTDAATSGLTIASGVISVNSGTAANNIVKLNGSAQLPAVSGALLTNLPNSTIYKNGIATYDLATASGNQTIAHGLGVTPKYVRIRASNQPSGGSTNQSNSEGIYNGTTMSHWYQTQDSAGTYITASASNGTFLTLITLNSSGLNQTCTISVDATNITLAWTRNGSVPAGTALLLWEAQG